MEKGFTNFNLLVHQKKLLVKGKLRRKKFTNQKQKG